MSNTHFTPGPWIHSDDGFIYGEGEMIASPHCTKELDIDEREANANLIAAAPDLYELLKRVHERQLNSPGYKSSSTCLEIEEALNKANPSK